MAAVKDCPPPPAEAVTLFGETVTVGVRAAPTVMVTVSVTPLTVALRYIARSRVDAAPEVYVTVVPVVDDSEPGLGLAGSKGVSAQVTVPVPFGVAVKACVLPPAAMDAPLGEIVRPVAGGGGGGGGVDVPGMVMAAVSFRAVP